MRLKQQLIKEQGFTLKFLSEPGFLVFSFPLWIEFWAVVDQGKVLMISMPQLLNKMPTASVQMLGKEITTSNVSKDLRDRGGGGAGRAMAPPLFCTPAPTFCVKQKNN